MANPRKKIHALLIVTIVTVLAAAAAVGCFMISRNYTDLQRTELARQQAEVNEYNNEQYENYLEAVAEYQEKVSAREGANESWPTPEGSGWEVIDLSNFALEGSYPVTMTRQETMYNGMLLVNEWHSRPDDFSEYNLVSLSSYSSHQIGVKNSTVRLFPAAAEALLELVRAAKENGYENYVVYDAYRTWDEQNSLFQTRLAAVTKDHPNYNSDRLIEIARKSVNYPGTSSYNGGQTFRINLYKKGDNTVNNKVFFESDEGLWFYDHCWEYGIIFRFQLADYPVKGTTDKGYKTGVNSQLQTFSYVGKGNAAVMKNMDLCMEEYIEYLMEHPHIAVFQDGVLKYEISRQYIGDSESFNVNLVGTGRVKDYTASMDNMGYVIVVFEY